MRLLITGPTGKVGVNLIDRLLREPRWRAARYLLTQGAGELAAL